ncbi:MAG: DUF2157 domain-containing protein [Acidobacteria bacterium]|nr:DUF2157 domain-containing protein [Acidobacteriota bacterium]
MTSTPNRSAKFRAALKAELLAWVQDGLVSAESAEQITQRYQLDKLEKESSRLLAAVLFTLGSLLLGGGVISFVAAHWEELPVVVKVALVFALLLAFHLTGYWLRFKRASPRLGHALLFCGSLVFGAKIGLMAQIFHVSGEWYRAYLAWGVGALVMAWAVRSWLTGVLVLVTTFVWFAGFAEDSHERAATVYPFLLAAALLPLAWRTGSRVLSTLTFLGIICALPVLAGIESEAGMNVLLALLAGGFVTWAAGEFQRTTGNQPEFGNPLAMLGVVVLAGCTYVWSFHYVWDHGWAQQWRALYGLLPTGAALALGVALLVQSWASPRSTRLFSYTVLLALLLSIAAVVLGKGRVAWPTVAMNLAALLFAALSIGKGIADQRRLAFWAGTLFLVLLILSRFFEYETGLLLKSAAFIGCGALILVAGIGYERWLQRREVQA